MENIFKNKTIWIDYFWRLGYTDSSVGSGWHKQSLADFYKICIWDERISIELDDLTLTINTSLAAVQRVAQLKLRTILNLHLYELQKLIDGKTCNLIKKITEKIFRPSQNCCRTWRRVIEILSFKFLKALKILLSEYEKFILEYISVNKIQMVGKWIKSAFLFLEPGDNN